MNNFNFVLLNYIIISKPSKTSYIHAVVNAITRAYTSIPEKVSQVQCILQEHHGYFSSPDASSKTKEERLFELLYTIYFIV